MNVSSAGGHEITTDVENDFLEHFSCELSLTLARSSLHARLAHRTPCAESVYLGLESCQKTGQGFQIPGIRGTPKDPEELSQ